MLFTVDEASYILDVPKDRLYYELKLSRINGAFKVLWNWRLDESGLREVYERYRELDLVGAACNIGFSGFAERLAAVKMQCMENPTRPTFTRIQRGRRMERPQRGFNSLANQKQRDLENSQLLLFSEEDFF